MKVTTGIISFTEINNNINLDPSTKGVSVQFSRYNDNQQIVLWLPTSGWNDYSVYKLFYNKIEFESNHVKQKLNGEIQMVWDTSEWSSGSYLLEIYQHEIVKHSLKFEKDESPTSHYPYDSGVIQSDTLKDYKSNLNKLSIPNQSANSDNEWSDEELAIREQANNMLIQAFSNLNKKEKEPFLEFDEQGRSGTIYYIENKHRIPFYYEFGGGEVQVIINTPTSKDWEIATGLPLNERRRVLLTIASGVIHKKAPGWRFEIEEDNISFYLKN